MSLDSEQGAVATETEQDSLSKVSFRSTDTKKMRPNPKIWAENEPNSGTGSHHCSMEFEGLAYATNCTLADKALSVLCECK